MPEPVFLTIGSLGYLPQARCLFESLRVHHPDARLVLFLTEETFDPTLVDSGDFEVILAKDVVGSRFIDMAFRYDIVELNTAVKPFAMGYLLGSGAAQVTYIDPDCFVFSPLVELAEAHAEGANIVLTPHATKPIDDDRSPGELDLLRAGTFNLGFVSVREGEVAREFLDWWSDRLTTFCVADPTTGLFVDQKWADLAPSFFEGVVLMRHPGYNVAYWNAFQREIERRPGGWHVDGEPLRFFHFSAIPLDDVAAISRHQNRLNAESIGPFFAEFQTYLARLASNALSVPDQKTYSYSLYWQERPIASHAVRAALRRVGDPAAHDLAEFQDEARVGQLLQPHPDLPIDEMFPISRLLYDAWLHAPLIAQQYPLFTAEGRAQFLYWVLDGGYEALQIDRSLLPWRELTTAVPGALGGKLAIPPLLWLVWLADRKLRRSIHLKDEATFATLLIQLQKQVSEGDRPAWVLPQDYVGAIVVGEGDDTINVAQFAVWRTREDLQAAFDLDSAQARRAFAKWCGGPSPATECPWMAPLIQPRCERDAA